MGFFSWNCKACGKSIISGYASCEINDWMKNVVVLKENGSRIIGEYGGYGDVGGMEIHWDGDPCVYHQACWEKAGRPDYDGPSDHAQDQGYFFGEEHDMLDPSKEYDDPEGELARLRAIREERWAKIEKEREAMERFEARCDLEDEIIRLTEESEEAHA
jgi:hypothetical protein